MSFSTMIYDECVCDVCFDQRCEGDCQQQERCADCDGEGGWRDTVTGQAVVCQCVSTMSEWQAQCRKLAYAYYVVGARFPNWLVSELSQMPVDLSWSNQDDNANRSEMAWAGQSKGIL